MLSASWERTGTVSAWIIESSQKVAKGQKFEETSVRKAQRVSTLLMSPPHGMTDENKTRRIDLRINAASLQLLVSMQTLGTSKP